MSSKDTTINEENVPGIKVGRLMKSDRLAGAIVVALLISALQIASMMAPHYIAPPPLAVLQSIWDQIVPMWDQILITLLRLAVSLSFAMVLGTLLGVVMGMLPWLRPYIRSLVVIDTGIPALSWMLIAVFWVKEPDAHLLHHVSHPGALLRAQHL
jgi:NitT/TauT family transport system permease protein